MLQYKKQFNLLLNTLNVNASVKQTQQPKSYEFLIGWYAEVLKQWYK
jgi:hypothetical protein